MVRTAYVRSPQAADKTILCVNQGHVFLEKLKIICTLSGQLHGTGHAAEEEHIRAAF